jgi:AcrR family transcriptional regulator
VRKSITEDRETRDRVLKAAERLFAERGFKRVTVREICRAAHANVAAVNYHFGDKLGLYREVFQIAIDAIRETTEAARAAGEGQPADERLRRYIAIFLRRVLARGGENLYRLVNREMNDPTPALDTLVEQGVRPRVVYLTRLVADMMGCEPSNPRVMQCVASIQTQFVAYLPNPIARRLGFHFKGTPAEIDQAARHIAEFSAAGIHAVARGLADAVVASPGARGRAVRA